MTKKHLTVLIAGMVIMACMSGAVMAGRARILYGYSKVHQYGFTPDEQLLTKLNPPSPRPYGSVVTPSEEAATKTDDATTSDKIGAQANYQWGNRQYYRKAYPIEAKTPGAMSWSIGGKLGNKWPTTMYNQDIGKGRELSRIFK